MPSLTSVVLRMKEAFAAHCFWVIAVHLGLRTEGITPVRFVGTCME